MSEPELLDHLRVMARPLSRPLIVALDGGSGAGKSTIANLLERSPDVGVVDLDDFYQTSIPESELPTLSTSDRLATVFDWERVREEALRPLRDGRPARWHSFDFASGLNEAGTYDLKDTTTSLEPQPIVVLEGAYSASRPLADLIDVAVLVDVPTAQWHQRLGRREDAEFIEHWHRLWDEVERHYFEVVGRRESYDLLVRNEDWDEPGA